MDLLAVLRQQRAGRFRDLAGASATVTVPVSDRLVTQLVVDTLPPGGAVRDLDLRAHASNRFAARVRLTRPAFLPSIAINALIERQPQLPASPVIVFRVSMAGGLMAFAGPAMRFLGALPPGIHLDGERLEVDLGVLLNQYGAREALDYVHDLQLTTEEGRFVVSLRAAVGGDAGDQDGS
jgi:hypothetical protein